MDFTLLYIRVPKTASTTVWRSVIHHQYADKRLHGGMSRLWSADQSVRDELDVISGHGPYGLHKLITRPSVYIVTLREPIDRTLSHYYYLLSRPDHRLAPLVNSMSMREYFSRDNQWDLANIQTKFLSGDFTHITAIGPINDGPPDDPNLSMNVVFEHALQNLETCLIGFQDELDKSMTYFSRILKWRYPINKGMTRKNYDRPPLESEPQWVLNMVSECNRLDIKLYNYAKELWNAQLEGNKTIEDYYI